MVELQESEYDLARPLYADAPYGRPVIYSVLEGTHPGHVFVDSATAPRTAFVVSTAEFYYLAGETWNRDFVDAALDLALGEYAPERFVFLGALTDAWRATLDAGLRARNLKPVWAERFEYELDVARFRERSAGWRERIPAQVQVRRYEREDVLRNDGILRFFRDADGFLRHGLGYGVWVEGQMVSCCHTVVVGDGRAEVGIETLEPFRRRGLATLAACAFIEECLESGLIPEWGCWYNNVASAALAERVGFRDRRPAPVAVIFR